MSGAAHAAVLLDAGASHRLGEPKQLLRLDGETLVHRAARMALATAPREAVIVLGHDAAATGAAVADLPLRAVRCADHARGMGASLATGLAALSADCAGALVLLCDQPALTAAHLQALVAAWRTRPAGAAASAYADVLGVPALLPRAWFAQIDAEGDRGARQLLRERRAEVLAVACAALAADIDTPAQRAAWE